MPLYYAAGRADLERQQLQSDVLLIEDMLRRFQDRYPYVNVQCVIDIDVQERERVLKRRYTYGTNIEY